MKLATTIKDKWQSFEKYPTIAWTISFVWLAFICWLAFIWNLGNIGLIDETEPLFAEAARQTIVRGDWITPYFNEVTRFDKPPLIYWLMAIAYKVIGVNEWAVRLPSAIAAIALTVFCFYTLRYFGFVTPAAARTVLIDKKIRRQLWFCAWLGAAFAALNMQTIAWARQGVSDMLLSGCIGTSLFCFFWGYASGESGRGREWEMDRFSPVQRTKDKGQRTNYWYLGFYVLSALAVLTKGPVGVVLPGLIIVSFLIYIGKFWEVLKEMHVVLGGAIFLAICLPWYILVTIANGDAFINSFFGYHNFDRFTSVVNNHSAPWYFYFLIVLGLFAPWSIYLPIAIARLHVWRRSFWMRQPRHTHLSLFAFVWFACIFVFFSISITKLPSYVLPLIPALSILVALFWSEELLSRDRRSDSIDYGFLVSIFFNIILLLLLAIASFLIPQLIGTDAAMDYLSELIQRANLPIYGAIIWAIAFIAFLFLIVKKTLWRWLIIVNLIGFIAFALFFVNPAFGLLDITRQLPLRQISELVTQVGQPDEKIMMIGFKKPSIVFYTHKPVGFFWTFDRPATVFLQNLANNSPPDSTLLIIGQPNEIADTGLQPQDYRVLGEKPPYRLIRVATERALQQSLAKNGAN